MGKLTPGASYIYERDGGITYAREFGSTDRQVIGMDYPLPDTINWYDVHILAKTNPALQSALDRVIMIYKLTKEKYE